jgi:hypothetical protein
LQIVVIICVAVRAPSAVEKFTNIHVERAIYQLCLVTSAPHQSKRRLGVIDWVPWVRRIVWPLLPDFVGRGLGPEAVADRPGGVAQLLACHRRVRGAENAVADLPPVAVVEDLQRARDPVVLPAGVDEAEVSICCTFIAINNDSVQHCIVCAKHQMMPFLDEIDGPNIVGFYWLVSS